ncbi:hypothetical protein [Actinophytocola sp.]|uniref:hypothetical protein n=1 Tax=Actinophytocola sp. TaxID=1872138 RepID=UPI003D6A38E1
MTDPDLRTLHEDDRLLDRLGRGVPLETRGRDDAEAMLVAWRRSMPDAGPPDPRLLDAIARPPRPRRRLAAASLGVVASVALVGGGMTVAAAHAFPDSPLWPVTRLVYGELAESRQALDGANHALSDARKAAKAGRYPEALRLLATADALADKVDQSTADRLRDDIESVRGMLPDDVKTPAGPARVPEPSESLGVETPSLGPDGVPGKPGTPDVPDPGGDGDGDRAGDNRGANGGENNRPDTEPRDEPAKPHKEKAKPPHGLLLPDSPDL